MKKEVCVKCKSPDVYLDSTEEVNERIQIQNFTCMACGCEFEMVVNKHE